MRKRIKAESGNGIYIVDGFAQSDNDAESCEISCADKNYSPVPLYEIIAVTVRDDIKVLGMHRDLNITLKKHMCERFGAEGDLLISVHVFRFRNHGMNGRMK